MLAAFKVPPETFIEAFSPPLPLLVKVMAFVTDKLCVAGITIEIVSLVFPV